MNTLTCPVCSHESNLFLQHDEELQLINTVCEQCSAELKISLWIKNNHAVMLSVIPHDLDLEWVEDINGDLILSRLGKPIKSSRIPKLMLTYSDVADGEIVKVNVEGLKKHIEKQHGYVM